MSYQENPFTQEHIDYCLSCINKSLADGDPHRAARFERYLMTDFIRYLIEQAPPHIATIARAIQHIQEMQFHRGCERESRLFTLLPSIEK